MRKQPQITEKTKPKIISAFWQLYKTSDISHISIKKVMEIAGYNRCTFYEYFNDIYDPLYYIEESIISFIKLNIISNISNFKIDKNILNNVIYLYQEKGEYISILLSENGDLSFKNKIKTELKPIFYSNFHLIDTPHSEIIFEYTISGLINAFSYWYKNKNKISINDFTEMIYPIIFNGTMSEIKKLQTKKQ